MEESVSYNERMKRGRRMHSMAKKLSKIKQLKQKRVASTNQLKKRSQILAHMLLIKKLTGYTRTQYQQLSTAQKIHIASIIEKIPQKHINELAKRMLPIVTKAELARVKAMRGKTPLNEVAVGLRQRMHRSHKGQLRGHIRRSKGYERPHRQSTGGLTKSGNRLARQRIIKSKFFGLKTNELSPEEDRVIQTFISTGKRSDAVRAMSRKYKHRGHDKRADHRRLSQRDFNRYDRQDRGIADLLSSTQYDPFAEVLVEGSTEKFQQLFIKGLVPMNKVEHYKRIFVDLNNSIKYQRFQKDIADMINRLIELVTNNSVIYNRLKLDLQKERMRNGKKP